MRVWPLEAVLGGSLEGPVVALADDFRLLGHEMGTTMALIMSGDAPEQRGSLNGSAPRCEHLDAIMPVAPRSSRCGECRDGDHGGASLLVCLTCGWVACSDDSPGKHALAHYQETDHPVAGALPPGSKLRWCYVHRRPV
jgi:uncharacterized UBP type Zn finger protein